MLLHHGLDPCAETGVHGTKVLLALNQGHAAMKAYTSTFM